ITGRLFLSCKSRHTIFSRDWSSDVCSSDLEQPLQMVARTRRSLTRGKLRPDARLDLHGMTLAVAKAELTGFILRAQAAGLRLVQIGRASCRATVFIAAMFGTSSICSRSFVG